jgi:hypothetical protein
MAKLSLFDIGYILIDNIINVKNDSNKIKLLSAVKTHNIEVSNKKEEIIRKTNIYLNEYEIKRKNNNNNYDKFLKKKEDLFNKWKQSKKIKDLYNLISLQQPEYEDVPDIYTINKIDNYETI